MNYVSNKRLLFITIGFLVFAVGCNDRIRYPTDPPSLGNDQNVADVTGRKTDLIIENISKPQPEFSEIRGVWVQAESINTQENIDETIRKAEIGGFNAVFVNVFLYGKAMYDSEFVKKNGIVSEHFNPLSYLISEAHFRGIQVHAWFVAGAVGYREGSPLDLHPDWALVGPDGGTTGWLNFTRPDVRQFTSDLMMEVIERYQVDGIHFDYTRYPGPEWGFDPYSIEQFQEEYELDLNVMRYSDLPAFGNFEGNPLNLPGSAKVLASFSNGNPAVTLNEYGEGEVLLLNWDANKRRVAVGTEIMQRSIQRMLGENGQVYLLNSETNAEEYGKVDFERAQNWLQDLGWAPIELSETEIGELDSGSILILPNVYLISAETAKRMAVFVEEGGGIIFIDGPTRSITNGDVRAITGMNFRGRYFNTELMMNATGEHALIPVSGRNSDIEIYQEWDTTWKDFRKQEINQLIEGIYERVNNEYPEVIVSVTVADNLESAANVVLQDWSAWLKGEYIDLLIPRFYVDNIAELNPMVDAWKPVLGNDKRINIGIITHFEDINVPKSPEQLIAEMKLVEAAGSNGIMMFDLDNMSEDQLRMLGELDLFNHQP